MFDLIAGNSIVILIPVVILLVIRYMVVRKRRQQTDDEPEQTYRLHFEEDENSVINTFTRADIKTNAAASKTTASKTAAASRAGSAAAAKTAAAAKAASDLPPNTEIPVMPAQHQSLSARLGNLPEYQKAFVYSEIFAVPKGLRQE
ncbi:MAG: hypothetical protein FWD78_10755 [Treponema sp.]|nr:hypothetical protein [Treponema sp.]